MRWIDRVVFGVVVIIAGTVIGLSIHSTAMLADALNLNAYLMAGLVEILFASLLFIRGRQRATQRNVPFFLNAGYFASLGFVTAVNMWGLAHANLIIGPIVGAAISGAMWMMESCLVWLIVDSHKPYKKSIWRMKYEAKRDIKEEKSIQWIEWQRSEARKPDLALIRAARKSEEARKKVEAEGLPEYFAQWQDSSSAIEPIPVEREAEIVPIKRTIGFHMEDRTPETEQRTSNTEKPVISPSNTSSNTKTERIIKYVMGLIEQGEVFTVTTVANDMECSRSTASVAIRKAKEQREKMNK
ncbi:MULTISPECIES: hypothetical protein [Thermoactinomyces]|uniref:DUF2637 domain-containing protein n=1 Tax=Thermoactinomyces daqus TaxID=1329516 RepID=A0A7W2AHZ4_9BACL|nr:MULTISPECIES: hypothetical protein [Thermoactinomyces]MBA4542715.1 hypothetical protein [Thermoactinomyces daqus]MBH8607285.1 hypothetical protein [Thermoactinomyces sp. CICC 10521]